MLALAVFVGVGAGFGAVGFRYMISGLVGWITHRAMLTALTSRAPEPEVRLLP